MQRQKIKLAGQKERKKTETETETDAHLSVAIRRKDYSIALTKCFQNTVKLQERRNKGGEVK